MQCISKRTAAYYGPTGAGSMDIFACFKLLISEVATTFRRLNFKPF